MMSRYNIYVQAINYPTVAKGAELLRIATTPHHDPQMMSDFVGRSVRSDSPPSRLRWLHRWSSFSTGRLVETWEEVGLQLRPRASAECHFCQQPLHFETMSERERSFFAGLGHVIPAVA